jgi:hypothetical protein
MSKNGLILLTPTSIAYTGTSASISANGSVSFSSIGTLSLNGVFSADYDNYRVVIVAKSSSVYDSIRVRYRASGTDDTGSNYTYQVVYATGTSVTAARATESNIYSSLADPTLYGGVIYDIYGPYLTQPTAFRSIPCMVATDVAVRDVASTHSQSTSYDGLTIYPSQGTSRPLTGRIAVYGMRK